MSRNICNNLLDVWYWNQAKKLKNQYLQKETKAQANLRTSLDELVTIQLKPSPDVLNVTKTFNEKQLQNPFELIT